MESNINSPVRSSGQKVAPLKQTPEGFNTWYRLCKVPPHFIRGYSWWTPFGVLEGEWHMEVVLPRIRF